ncbi:MAG: hypothetical protein HFF96_05460 [Oscillibacter sp.]|uniref:hypothetical protein n=1 Tax=Oscillibacter sp. TaxID=1945593 RepID=UPI00216D3006|nr:hypothetical protein [Oscillibacter sp.]MCI8840935.1 hypothetical protein [Oscillibacter sp.]MCI9113696.1 hypothetical protein [Oscillibacter sp.]
MAADEGVEQDANFFLQASTIVDEAGMIDLENISILVNDGNDGETNPRLLRLARHSSPK